MSISTLQEKFFNKGCFTAGIVVISAAMALSMFTRGGGSSQNAGQDGRANAAATVGGIPLPAEAIQARADALQRQSGATGPVDASTQATSLVRATGELLQRAALQSLLEKANVTEADVAAAGPILIDRSLAQLRQQLIASRQLKPTSSDAEFEKAIQAQLPPGKTIAQLRADAPKNLVAQFKDPSRRAGVLDQVGGVILVDKLGEKAVGTDEALRDSYRSYVVRRVFLSAASGAKESPEMRAEKVLADLKAGKTFENEMDTMSNDPAPAGKKAHEASETVPAVLFEVRPELASLKGKAANALTPVTDVPGGKAIYQLVSTRSDLPPDFDKNKSKLRQDKIQSVGTTEVEKAIKALLAGGAVKWQSPGYRALAAVAEATPNGFVLDPAAGTKAFALGQAALKSENGADRRLAAQALLALTDRNATIQTGAADASANRRIALEAARANGIEDARLTLELAEAYAAGKDGAKATDALIAASKANMDYSVSGQRTFGDIAAKALDLQRKSLISKAQLESVQAQQALWTAARSENEKLSSQAKVSEEAQRKANEAELARQKAEAAKTAPPASDAANKKANEAEIARQKAEANKSPSTTGGSMLPTTAGAGK